MSSVNMTCMPLQGNFEHVECRVRHNCQRFIYELSNEKSLDKILDYFPFRVVIFLFLK